MHQIPLFLPRSTLEVSHIQEGDENSQTGASKANQPINKKSARVGQSVLEDGLTTHQHGQRRH